MRRCASLAACLAAAGAAEGALLAGWTAEKIGGPAQGHHAISGYTAINDAGEVAFYAEDLLGGSPHPSKGGIFVWSAGSFRTIGARVERGGAYAGLASVPGGISADGVVAFRPLLPGPGLTAAIVAGNGSTTQTLATGGCGVACEFDLLRLDPAIGASGLVAFVAPVGLEQRLYLQPASGGPRTLLTFADLPGASPLSGFGEGLSVNASGQVAFWAGLDTGINDVGVFVARAPGSVETLARSGDIAPDGRAFMRFSRPAINAAGDVAFCATLAGGASGIFLHRGGSLHTVADSLGTFDGFAFGAGFVCETESIPSLNDAGMVAFFSDGASAGDADDAIFLWDGAMHRLIGIGDEVGGETLTAIRYFGGGINIHGDIAFAGDVAGGDPLFVARAPRVAGVSEPGALALLAIGVLALRLRRRG